MKKASMQLSASFLVMMILAIVAFGLGVTLLYKIYDGIIDIPEEIDERIQNEIMQTITAGNKLAFYRHSVNVERGEMGTLYFGVKNTADYKKFRVKASCVNVCKDTCSPCNKDWVINDDRTLRIADTEITRLFVKVPDDAERGEYVHKLELRKHDDTEIYDTPKRFYVIVD